MSVKGLVPVVLLGVGFNIIVSTLLNVVPFPDNWMMSYQQNSGLIGTGNIWVAWLETVLLAPVLEEITFRGLMYTRLKKGMALPVAAVLTSLAFAAVHGTLIWGIYTFLLSLLLIWTFEKFQSLTANILLHVMFNVTGMIWGNLAGMPDLFHWICVFFAAVAFGAGCVLLYKTDAKTDTVGTYL